MSHHVVVGRAALVRVLHSNALNSDQVRALLHAVARMTRGNETDIRAEDLSPNIQRLVDQGYLAKRNWTPYLTVSADLAWIPGHAPPRPAWNGEDIGNDGVHGENESAKVAGLHRFGLTGDGEEAA